MRGKTTKSILETPKKLFYCLEARHCHFVIFGTKTQPLQSLLVSKNMKKLVTLGVWASEIFFIRTLWGVTPLTQWSTWSPSLCLWCWMSAPGTNHQIIFGCFMTHTRVVTSKASQSVQRVWAILEMWAWDSSSGLSFSEPWGWIKYSSKS